MIFLSASIPLEDRDPRYFETADIIAIRDAVRALAAVVIPKTVLVWGGHPSITPLVNYVVQKMSSNVKEHVVLYKEFFADEDLSFENVITIPEKDDRNSSLLEMRIKMLEDRHFTAGIFIGGMEGVEEEYKLFRKMHPEAIILPIATTGAAAKIIYDNLELKQHPELESDYAYMSIFRNLLL